MHVTVLQRLAGGTPTQYKSLRATAMTGAQGQLDSVRDPTRGRGKPNARQHLR